MKELLLLDDEPEVLKALQREIESALPDADFSIITFTSPKEALTYLEETSDSVFLVISDLRMPEMKGSEFLLQMRQAHGNIHSVLLTAFADLDNIQTAFQSSLQGLIMKPWTTESILFEIEKASSAWNLEHENARLKSKISQLLSDAGDFQKQLFGNGKGKFGSGMFSIAYEPMDEYGCGGDFFEIRAVDNGFTVILGDVSGHGPKSAIVAGMMKSLIHSTYKHNANEFSSPHLLIEQLNNDLSAMLEQTPDILVAMLAVYVDPDIQEISVCNAGLPSAFLYQAGTCREIGTVQPPIAFVADQIYKKDSYQYSDSSRLYLFTDGLIESASQLGIVENIQSTLSTIISDLHSGSTLSFGSAPEILELVKQTAGIQQLSDDLTFICLNPGG